MSEASQIGLSASAARRVAQLIAQEGRPDLKFRLAVSGGGCSGFQYAFEFDDKVNADDLVVERDGVQLLIDETSRQFLGGAEVDYVENLLGSSFQVKNPNATASCGCGTSFSV
jgi:iron-sulfur cluster insertion protein